MMKHHFLRTSFLTLVGFVMLTATLAPGLQYRNGDLDILCQVYAGKSYAMQKDSVTVNFIVTIPFWTPENDSIYLTGSSFPTLIPFSNVNKVTWTTKIKLPVSKTFDYRYTRGDSAKQAIRQLSFTPSETDSVRYDPVIRWFDIENPVSARHKFIGIVAIIDFPAPGVIQGWWDRDGSGNYSYLAETYRKIRDRAGLNYVGFPEGAFHSQLQPLPVIVNEDQGMRDLTGAEFTKIVQLAQEQNLNYFVHAGNPGMTQELADQIGTDNPFAWIPQNISEGDTAWWDQWFKQWGDFLEPKAITAEALGVELFSIGAHLDFVDIDFNSSHWISLINRIRNVYSGKIVYFSMGTEGPNTDWSSLLDYIGVYMGRPIASNSEPTISELVDGISSFVDNVPHPKPVIFYLDFASIDSASLGVSAPDILEPTAHLQIDFQEQADIYEAFFRVMEERKWIAGFLSWNYAYDDDFLYYPDPNVHDDTRFTSSIRNKLAEAVTFKWRFTFDTTATGISISDIKDVSKKFQLFQNYPNPFNLLTTIHYQLYKPEFVTIRIYNLRGQNLCTLVDEEKQTGTYKIKWDGKNRNGQLVTTGVYIIRMLSGDFVESKKILLLK